MENMIQFSEAQTVTTAPAHTLDFGVILVALGLAEQPAEEPAAEPTNSLSIVFNNEDECEGPIVETRLGKFRARYVLEASVRFSGRAHVSINSTYGWLFEEIGGDRSDMLLDSKFADLREACEWLRRNHSVSYAHPNTRVSVTLR